MLFTGQAGSFVITVTGIRNEVSDKFFVVIPGYFKPLINPHCSSQYFSLWQSMGISLDSIHRWLASSTFATKLAVKVRNQANSIIGYHLGETASASENGECRVIDRLHSHIQTFIDVGANMGEWTQHLLNHKPTAQGFLFEPSAQCAQALSARFDRYEDITIRNVAISDSTGFGCFIEDSSNSQHSHLVSSPSNDKDDNVQVPIVRLDDEFSATDLRLDFLKIDTEGYDLKVLKGATALLERTRYIQFEYNASWAEAGCTLADALQYLQKLGFSVYLIRSSGLHPLQYDYWREYFRYSNFLACREVDKAPLMPLLQGVL